MLTNEHAKSLADRAIDTKAANKNQLETVAAASAASELGVTGGVYGDAIRIPYMNIDGSPYMNEDGTPHVRFRVFDTRTDAELIGKKRQRYIGRTGAGAMPYIPHGAAELSALGAEFIVITEGEFKAISATSIGVPTIAIPGVTMWSDGSGSLGADSTIANEIIETIHSMCATGVIVLADSDASENVLVSNAMNAFTGALKCSIAIPVMYAHVPAKTTRDGRRKLSEKQGLDDWIVNAGAESVRGMLRHLWNSELRRIQARSGGGYDALGYKDESNFVWSRAKSRVFSLTANAITSASSLMNIVGGYKYCEAEYGEVNPKNGAITVNFTRMGGDLVERCWNAGVFNPDSLCGSGVWMNANGGISINSAEHFWNADGTSADRIQNEDDRIYQASIPLGITPESEVGTTEDAQFIFDGMGTWNFRSLSDRTLMYGWLMLSYLAAAAPWRPHASLTAPPGSGKSTLQLAFKNLLGKACCYLEGAQSSAAGIMQGLNQDAIAVIVGESESNTEKAAEKVKDLLTFLRSCSDGTVGIKGTATHNAKRFLLRSMGMVAGVTSPSMTAADESRFLCIEINPRHDSDAEVHLLASKEPLDQREVQRLGRRMFMRMINSWPRLVAAEKELRKSMRGSSRFLDTFTPLIAASWVAMNDGSLSEQAAADLLKSIELDDQRDRIDDAMSSNDIIDTLMTSHIYAEGAAYTVATVVEEARNEAQTGRLGKYQNALGLYGMRVFIPIVNRNGKFVKLSSNPMLYIHPASALKLINNNFDNESTFKKQLKKSPYIATTRTPQSIGGVTRRVLELNIKSNAAKRRPVTSLAANDREYNRYSSVAAISSK